MGDKGGEVEVQHDAEVTLADPKTSDTPSVVLTLTITTSEVLCREGALGRCSFMFHQATAANPWNYFETSA